MPSLAQALGEPLSARVQEICTGWAKRDWFARGNSSALAQAQGVHSVRSFINVMLQHTARHGLMQPLDPRRTKPAGVDTLEWTLRSFLECRTRYPETPYPIPLGVFFKALLVDDAIPALLVECSSHSASPEGCAEHERLIQGAGCATWREVLQKAADPQVLGVLQIAVLEWVLPVIEHRKLRSFYEDSRNEMGFYAWWPGAQTGLGQDLPTRTYDVPGGRVTVEVSSYVDHLEDAGRGIRAYEWNAHLWRDPDPASQEKQGQQAIPSAVACGMVYVLRRQDGILWSSVSDLRWAADAVADADVAQVMAFLHQHPDHEEVLRLGDLCFLWLWERREGAPRGDGELVLRTALQDLKRRFRALKTLVVNLRPAPFSHETLEDDPPAVHVGRQEACERVEAVVMKAELGACLCGDVRFIESHLRGPEETLAALADLDQDDPF